MVTVSAHFDGRVIVPDEPLDLPPNQALILQIERVDGAVPSDESALTWLAANAIDSEALPTISLTGTITISTAPPRRTNDSSGRLLRRYRLLDCYIQQTRSVSFPSCRLAPIGGANREPDCDDRAHTP